MDKESIRQGVAMAKQSKGSTAVPFPLVNDIELPTGKAIKASTRIDKLKKSELNLSQIQKELERLIDAMAQNPSMLSRATYYWGSLPLWQKITTGLLLATPTLMIGILAQLTVYYIITALVLICYTGASVVLDDHHSHAQRGKTNIKSGITNLAAGLNTVTDSLEQISDALSEQITLFSEENEHFGENISDLKTHNTSLQQEIDKLKTVEKTLSSTVSELETLCSELKKSTEEQTNLLEATQASLNKLKINYAQNQKQLEEKINELSDLTRLFSSAEKAYNENLEALKEALDTMAKISVDSKEQRDALYKETSSFIKNNNPSLLDLHNILQTKVREVSELKQKLQAATDKQEELVNRAEQQVNLLEQQHGKNPQSYFYKMVSQDSEELQPAPAYQ
jgi:DNA repair exonuclease SbcCD ATPase subunit